MAGDLYVGNNDINGLLFCAALLPSAPSGLCLAALDCRPCRASTLHLAFLPFAAAGQMAARTRQSGGLEADHTLMDALHKCQVTSDAGLAGALGSASAYLAPSETKSWWRI